MKFNNKKLEWVSLASGMALALLVCSNPDLAPEKRIPCQVSQ
ncbi:hypothetical protein [Pseudomonas syringae group genomosp. 3]|nr:hypothetical protein [Pseudomonas syringae group genomosp. 3]